MTRIFRYHPVVRVSAGIGVGVLVLLGVGSILASLTNSMRGGGPVLFVIGLFSLALAAWLWPILRGRFRWRIEVDEGAKTVTLAIPKVRQGAGAPVALSRAVYFDAIERIERRKLVTRQLGFLEGHSVFAILLRDGTRIDLGGARSHIPHDPLAEAMTHLALAADVPALDLGPVRAPGGIADPPSWTDPLPTEAEQDAMTRRMGRGRTVLFFVMVVLAVLSLALQGV